MSINVRWCLVWSHSSPWSPVAASGLTLWSGSSQCQAVLGPAWSGWVQPLHPEASVEWLSLVTTPEIAFVTLSQSAKQSRSESGGMRDGCRLRHWVVPRMMTKLGFVWILIYRACPGSGPSVLGCQCTVASQAALATHCLPHWQCQEGWVPAAAWQMWKLVPLKPNIAIETSKHFFIPLYFDTRDRLFII